MRNSRIIIVDDHAVVRTGLRTIFAETKDLEVVGEGSTGMHAISLHASLRADLILLDMRLPDLQGPEVCRRLKECDPAPAVIILTSYLDDFSVLAALNSGADGYLLKDVGGQDIVAAVRSALMGVSTYVSEVASIVRRNKFGGLASASGRHGLLSSQEARLMELVVKGLTNKEIGPQMNLAEGTVRNYLSTIFGKLGVQSRAEAAVRFVREHGSD